MNVLHHTPDTSLLLAKLATTLSEYQEPVDRYLQQSGEYEVVNPLQDTDESAARPMEAFFSSTFWEMLGIRHVITNIHHSKTASRSQWTTATETGSFIRGHMRNEACIEVLTKYLGNCSIIQFADYVSVKEAADFWDGLFADVIKNEIEKRTTEYIFQLGDITGRKVFEVDELLDIIGAYSTRGRVSMVLDEQEALKLWDLLCGIDYEPPPKEKYQLMFGTMHIDTLLIFYNNGVLLNSKDGQIDFAGRSLNNIHTYPYSRDFFLAGYRLGLLLHLTIQHAIALGLAVSGTYRASASIPTTGTLLAYINDWVSAITKI